MTNPSKPLLLWAVPRSVSTAFERVFLERGDFHVVHEPFSATYYFSNERRSERYIDQRKPQEQFAHQNVLRDLLKPRDKAVFAKDMAYYTAGFMNPNFVSNFTNTFIVREPRGALASLHKIMPGFTFEEAGYGELYRLYSYAKEVGQEPIVVDAEDLLKNPDGTIAAYCQSLGVPFFPDALSWETREVPEWKMWDEWHTAAVRSTGIGKVRRREAALPVELEKTYERCLTYYEELRDVKILPEKANQEVAL